MEISIPRRIVTFESKELENWKKGDRQNCNDPYCKKLPGSKGFGEYIAGRYYESLGYEWIHHDYNIFGGNKLGKYPKAEKIIRSCFGDERYEKGRGFYPHFAPFINVEEPDLMIYKPDYSEIIFAECKREDTKDKLRDKQVKGLALLKLLFDCHIEVIEVSEEGRKPEGKVEPLIWEF